MQVTINCDTAEEIVRVWQDEEQLQMGVNMLRRLQDQVAQQCRQNRLFCRTVDALQDQYGRRMYAAKQLLQRFENTIAQLEQQIEHLQQQKQTIERQMDRYEHDLPLIQQYAHDRQIKRSKRQRQYNTLYWIPLVANRYKLKYMRARDKFAKAEHQVAQIRQAMETCQRTCRRIAQSLCHTRDQHEQTCSHRNRTEKQLQHLDNTLLLLDEGRRFWYDFEKYQARIVIESADYLIRWSSPATTPQQLDQWIKTFKMACFEYDECLKHGEERWFTIQVEFDCAICNNVRWEWPCLDIHGLLCHACQQSIIEAQRQLESAAAAAAAHISNNNSNSNENRRNHRLSTVSSAATSHKKKRISLLSDQTSSIRSVSRPIVKRILKSILGKCSSPKRPYSPLVH